MSWNNKIITKLMFPYVIFVGMFVFSKHQIGGYLCDCFAGSYEKITVDAVAGIFFIGSMGVAYWMDKNKKEWKFLYTLLTIILFLITFYGVMAIGEYLYVETVPF